MAEQQAKYEWHKLSPRVELAITRAFSMWLDTPYQSGQRAPKVACDCTQMMAGILDMLYKKQVRTHIPRMPPDSGIHSTRAGISTAMAFRSQYPSSVVRDYSLEPGDIVITRASADNNGPMRLGHCMMMSTRPGVAIHAVKPRSVMTSISASLEIMRIYRPHNKESWAV